MVVPNQQMQLVGLYQNWSSILCHCQMQRKGEVSRFPKSLKHFWDGDGGTKVGDKFLWSTEFIWFGVSRWGFT